MPRSFAHRRRDSLRFNWSVLRHRLGRSAVFYWLAVAALGIVTYLAATGNTPGDRATRQVIIATAAVDPGDTLSPADIAVVAVAEAAVPDDALDDYPDGSTPGSPIRVGVGLHRGDIVTQRHLSRAESELAAMVGDGRTAVSIDHDNEALPITVNDVVDLYSVDTGGSIRNVARSVAIVSTSPRHLVAAVPNVRVPEIISAQLGGVLTVALSGQ